MSSNAFSSFAYQSESAKAPVSNEQSSSRSAASSGTRRRIVLSDDDDDDDPPRASAALVTKSSVTSSNSSSPWLESRNPDTLSPSEKQANISAAVAQRKVIRSTIPKKPGMKRVEPLSDDDREEEEKRAAAAAQKGVMSKILSKSSLIKDSLLGKALDEDFDPLHDFRTKTARQRELERELRVQQRTAEETTTTTTKRRVLRIDDEDEEEENAKSSPVVVSSSSSSSANAQGSSKEKAKTVDLTREEEGTSSNRKSSESGKSKKKKKRSREEEEEDRASSSDEGGWRDELTKEELKNKAQRVLRQCEAVSANLRNSLRKWKGADAQSIATQSTTTSQTAEKDNGEEDCVNLLSIGSSADKAVLTDADIAVFCPTLRLNNYQLVGVNWLRLLHENKVNGVLADDMGLGKTVQTITFLGWLRQQQELQYEQDRQTLQQPDDDEEGSEEEEEESDKKRTRRRPHLVVVPASVLANWENEFEKFCPSLVVVKYHGSQAERSELRQELRAMIADEEVDVILSTYTIFEREACKADRSFIYAQRFDYLVLDEAHCIKNADSSRYANLNAIRTQHRLLLSGTPVQNDLSELLAMLSFLMPAVFGREDCALMMEAFGWSKGSAAAPKTQNGLSLKQLKSMLAPFVLRRLKRDVLDQLTEKRNELQMLSMSAMQEKIYNGIIERYTQKQLRNAQANSTSRGRVSAAAKKKRLTEGETASGKIDVIDLSAVDTAAETTHAEVSPEEVLQKFSGSEAKHLFTSLRKAANHPLLLRVHFTDEKVVSRIAHVAYDNGYFGEQCTFDRVLAEIETFSDYDIHQLCMQYEASLGKYVLDAEKLYDAPKMKCLRELLPRLQSEGHRMLLFSQWTRLLDLLEILLNDMNMSFLRLDGSTPIAERQELIDRFSSDNTIPVFLLSTKAGGLGINLTSADTVILHDLDFNPENDKQAEDRCHRIGQTKPVTVYRLVCAGTVDEDIYEMGERKRQLSQAVLSDHRDTETKKKSAHAKDDEDLNLISKILSKALSGKR